MNKTVLIGLLISLASAMTFAGNDLVVKVEGVNSDGGSIRLGLYDQAKTFKKEKRAVTVQETVASAKPVAFRIRDLPAGTYAIYVSHDADTGHSFYRMLGLYPSEGYGLSVNSDMNADESFANRQFVHAADTATEVTVYMRYCGNRPGKSVTKTFSCWMSLSP